MLYPLLRKELCEKRIAILLGVVWVLAPVLFWLQWTNTHVPALLKAILTGAAMLAPGLTMLLLATAPFFMERRNGTWEYLLSLPISRRRIVLVKWVVPLGLGILFMSLSSAVSWYPLTRLEPTLSTVGLLHWICLHSAGAALFMSILLLLDSLDWGECLGLRAIVSFLMIGLFIFSMQISGRSMTWNIVFWNSAISALCMGVAVVIFSGFTGESLLLPWRFVRNSRVRPLSSDGAWIWFHWRRTRMVLVLLLLPVPLLLAVQSIAVASQVNVSGLKTRLLEVMFSKGTNWPLSALMCICAAILGALTAVIDGNRKAVEFGWALPLARNRAQWIRMVFALSATALLYLPTGLFLVARAVYLNQTSIVLTANCIALLLLMACISTMSLLVASFASATRRVYGLAAIAGALCALVYTINNLTAPSGHGNLVMTAAAIAIVTAAWYLLPQIERLRHL